MSDQSPPLPEHDSYRLEYYNPVLDPACQAKMTAKMRTAAIEGRYADRGGPLNEPDQDHPANLVSSLCDDGFHRPALDIDIAMEVRPSKTPGHWHLEFPKLALSWHDYCNLLDALATAGIVEPGYVKASKLRGQTLLRTPSRPERCATIDEEPF